MKSPFTGKEMRRVYETRLWKFRGEEYQYIHSAWICEDSGEQFTDDAGDTAGYIQVTNQYREKYGIPYTDQMRLWQYESDMASVRRRCPSF